MNLIIAPSNTLMLDRYPYVEKVAEILQEALQSHGQKVKIWLNNNIYFQNKF